jgi:hypothetical protein
MLASAILDASKYVAEQVALSMRGLSASQASEQIYAFAIEIADDFAAVFKAANTERHFQNSARDPASRWQPSEWCFCGMDLHIGPLNDLLDDPTYQPDPAKDQLRPKNQAIWLKVMIEGLRMAREAGHLQWAGQSIVAFCVVQNSGLARWFASESARLVNPPELLATFEVELTAAWKDWESDAESDKVRAAYESLRT